MCWLRDRSEVGGGYLRLGIINHGSSTMRTEDVPGLKYLRVHFVERGNLGVPFQQRGNSLGQLICLTVELPYSFDDVPIVRINAMRAKVRVTGQMKLHDPVVRHGANVLSGAKP